MILMIDLMITMIVSMITMIDLIIIMIVLMITMIVLMITIIVSMIISGNILECKLSCASPIGNQLIDCFGVRAKLN